MDIKELHSFKLGDAVKFQNELNPKLFRGNRLDPAVKNQLITIAKDFLTELGVGDVKVKDITISGSNAAFTYTPHSDLDLHIVVDYNQFSNDSVYKELFNAKKNLYNDSHNITIRGIPVEVYMEDSSEPVISVGEYSVLKDKWNQIPTKRRANFDQTATKAKFGKLNDFILRALKEKDSKKIVKALKIIKRYRQAGLDKGGEFSPENLAYKALRSQKAIEKLYKLRDELHSRELSIENMYTEAKLESDKPIIYFDMDGVLADFNGGYEKLFNKQPSDSARDDPNVGQLVGSDFFATLNKLPGADALIKTAVQLFGGYSICSSPLRNDHKNSELNKRYWITKNLNPQPDNIVITGKKDSYAKGKNVLIDDKPKNIIPWRERGGIGILYNAYTDDPNKVIEQLKQIAGVVDEDIPVTQGPTQKQRMAAISKTQPELGSGHFGKVYDQPEGEFGIGTAKKVSRFDQNKPKLDGYYAYINKLMSLKDQTDNPYLPQVYNANIVKPKRGAPYFELDIEKLSNWRDLDSDELIMVFSKILNVDFNSLQDQYPYTVGRPGIIIMSGLVYFITQTLLDPNYKDKKGNSIKDPQLIEAINIIRHLYKSGYKRDLNGGNFMFRRTKYGPQLVITDPLSFGNQAQIDQVEQGKIRVNTMGVTIPPDDFVKEGDLDEDIPVTQGPTQKQRAAAIAKTQPKLGSGYFGKVYDQPEGELGIGTAKKISRFDQDKPTLDGYYAYINRLMSLKDQNDNPYLPQVYNANVVKPKRGAPYFELDMEKLSKWQDLDIDELLMIFSKALDVQLDSVEEFRQLVGRKGVPYKEIIIDELFRYIIKTISDPNYTDIKGNSIKDPQLIEAINIIRYLKKTGYGEDLHAGNVMVRRTKYGPQLVLTDPLSFGNQGKIDQVGQGKIRVNTIGVTVPPDYFVYAYDKFNNNALEIEKMYGSYDEIKKEVRQKYDPYWYDVEIIANNKKLDKPAQPPKPRKVSTGDEQIPATTTREKEARNKQHSPKKYVVYDQPKNAPPWQTKKMIGSVKASSENEALRLARQKFQNVPPHKISVMIDIMPSDSGNKLDESNISNSNDYGSIEGYVVDTTKPNLANYLSSQKADPKLTQLLSKKFSRIAILKNFYVDEDHRSKGIGREIFDKAIDDAYEDGAEAILLISDTSEQNKFDLTNWYKNYGFETIGMASGYPVMLLHETLNEEDDYSIEGREIDKRLKAAGYKKLGAGAEAAVYIREQGSVIKIIMPDLEDMKDLNRDFYNAEKTFLNFYNFVKKNKGNPFLPKFIPIQGKDYTRFKIGDRTFLQISMEQLYPYKKNSFEEAIVWAFSEFAASKMPWSEVEDNMGNPDTFEYFGDNPQQDYFKAKNTKPYSFSKAWQTLAMTDKNKLQYYQLLYETMATLYAYGRANNMGWDLHTDNVMRRKDGTLVITDPFYGFINNKLNEERMLSENNPSMNEKEGIDWERKLIRTWSPKAAAHMGQVVKNSFNSLYPDVPIRVRREDIFIMATTDPSADIRNLDIDVFGQRDNPNWECNFIVSPLYFRDDGEPYLELMVDSASSGQYKGVWKLIAQGWARYANSQLQKTGAKAAVFSVDEDHSDAWAVIANQAGLKFIVHN